MGLELIRATIITPSMEFDVSLHTVPNVGDVQKVDGKSYTVSARSFDLVKMMDGGRHCGWRQRCTLTLEQL